MIRHNKYHFEIPEGKGRNGQSGFYIFKKGWSEKTYLGCKDQRGMACSVVNEINYSARECDELHDKILKVNPPSIKLYHNYLEEQNG